MLSNMMPKKDAGISNEDLLKIIQQLTQEETGEAEEGNADPDIEALMQEMQGKKKPADLSIVVAKSAPKKY